MPVGMMRGEVTAWQLLLVVSLIRRLHRQSWRKMMDSVAPAQLRHEGCQGGAQHIHEGIKWMWGVYGVVLHVHVNQVGSWP